ncbi:MAG: 2-oxoacid:acceptor oxidoreductase family protein [Monoglobales bacterium]
MDTKKILLSGFGGQGILFAGKFLAYKGMIFEKEVSWLPSYGPEMRGGTASCSVIISDEKVGSPIISNPNILIAMNLPSLDRFESSVEKGGIIIADSSLIERKIMRDDVDAYYVPATKLANENGFPALANMIIVGKLLSVLGEDSQEDIEAVLKKVIPAKRADMAEKNLKAIQIGINL